MIKVDSYRRSTRQNNDQDANISTIDFGAGRGSTGVDLRFYPKDKFVALPQDQKDELREQLSTNEGKQSKKEFFQDKNSNKRDDDNKRKRDNNAGGNWKKKLKSAMKTEKGLKAVFAILGEEESSNQSFASALSTVALPPAPVSEAPSIPPATVTAASTSIRTVFPATSLKLRSILKKK